MGGPATKVRTTYWALAVCAVVVAGCAQFQAPRIDPTGERIFAEPVWPEDPLAPAYRRIPGPAGSQDRVDLIITPRRTVAPVGSEVILLAGVVGADNYLRTNERVDWTLDPAGSGHFVAVNSYSTASFLVGDFTHPRKVSNNYAITTTGREYLVLTRGTANTDDDVRVLRGQAWVSVSSPTEGTSYVTAVAPGVRSWPERIESAVIHWVDAQWSFPGPAIVPAGGRHLLTTTVMRQSDHSPCAGWLVRYQVSGGVSAGFAPDGASTIEVTTDSAGRATAEIVQPEPAIGATTVTIEVIRPPAADGTTSPLALGTGSVLISWSAASLVVRKTGPATAAVGSTMRYCIEVCNSGDMPAANVVLSDTVSRGTTYVDSDPPGTVTGGTVRWQLGTLAAGQSKTVALDVRADVAGTVENRAEAAAAGGLAAQAAATTQVGAAAVQPGGPTDLIGVRLAGPERATVGETVTFSITVTNRGTRPVSGLVIRDYFDAGLEHQQGASPIEKSLGVVLQPGRSQQIGVEFRVARAGRLCHSVRVISDGSVLASAEACLVAEQTSRPIPSPAVPGGIPGPETEQPSTLDLRIVPLHEPSTVGRQITYVVRVANRGLVPARNVQVVVVLPEQLEPIRFGTNGPPGTADPEIVGRQIRFAPVLQLPAGQTLEYRVRAGTLAVGQAVVRAELSCQGQLQPLITELLSSINPAP